MSLDAKGQLIIKKATAGAKYYGINNKEDLYHFLSNPFNNKIAKNYFSIWECTLALRQKLEKGDSITTIAKKLVTGFYDNDFNFVPSSNDENNKDAIAEALNYIESTFYLAPLTRKTFDTWGAGKKLDSIDDLFNGKADIKSLYYYQQMPYPEITKLVNEARKELGIEVPKEDSIIEEPEKIDLSTLSDIERFKALFEIGFKGKRGGKYLEDQYNNTNLSSENIFDIADPEERLIALKANALKNGKLTEDITVIKAGINAMDNAQKNYDKHNFFARVLSHFGLFKDIAKEREDIEFMKDSLTKTQCLSETDIDDIRKEKINKLPDRVVNKHLSVKSIANDCVNKISHNIKNEVEHLYEKEIPYLDRNAKDAFWQEKITDNKEDMLTVFNNRKKEYREFRNEMDKTYNKPDCIKYDKNETYMNKLLEVDKLDDYKKDIAKYKEMHKLGNEHDIDNKIKVITDLMKQKGEDPDKLLEPYIKKYKTDFEDKVRNAKKSAIEKKLGELYEHGIFENETVLEKTITKEKNMFCPERITEEEQKQFNNIGKDVNKQTKVEEVSKANVTTNDLSKQTEVSAPNSNK